MAEQANSRQVVRRAVTAVVIDAVVIVVFVVLGRHSHDSSTGLLEVSAPFLLGAATGWVVGRAWRRPFDSTSGLFVWVATVGLGMVLRWGVWDRGVALSFVLVTTVVTGLFLNGWRLIARRVPTK